RRPLGSRENRRAGAGSGRPQARLRRLPPQFRVMATWWGSQSWLPHQIQLCRLLLLNLAYRFVAACNKGIDDARERPAGNWRQPEEPQLTDRPSADKHRGTGAARRIHREIGNRDADQVDQRQPKADGDRREALRGAPVGGAQNNHQEHEGEHHFGHQTGFQRIAAGEFSANPLQANPPNSNPGLPVAITYSTAAPAMPPSTCATT